MHFFQLGNVCSQSDGSLCIGQSHIGIDSSASLDVIEQRCICAVCNFELEPRQNKRQPAACRLVAALHSLWCSTATASEALCRVFNTWSTWTSEVTCLGTSSGSGAALSHTQHSVVSYTVWRWNASFTRKVKKNISMVAHIPKYWKSRFVYYYRKKYYEIYHTCIYENVNIDLGSAEIII